MMAGYVAVKLANGNENNSRHNSLPLPPESPEDKQQLILQPTKMQPNIHYSKYIVLHSPPYCERYHLVNF